MTDHSASCTALVHLPSSSLCVQCPSAQSLARVMDMYSCRPMGASVARLIILVSGARSRSWN